MKSLSLNSSYIDQYLNGRNFTPPISLADAHKSIQDGTCKGSDYLGWINLAANTTEDFLESITHHAQEISKRSDVLLVSGIGGSYLGARAVIEVLGNTSKTQVIFLGYNLSGHEYERVFDSI